MYRIVWVSKLTGNTGYGAWMTDRVEADAWVEKMNAGAAATVWSIEENQDLVAVAWDITTDLLARLTLNGSLAARSRDA